MMIPTKDDFYSSFMVSEDNKVWVGIYRVMFGYRVRAGYMSTLTEYAECDWCCGASRVCLMVTYNLMQFLLDDLGYAPNDLPSSSRIKPWPLDEEFAKKLDVLLNAKGATYDLSSHRKALIDDLDLQRLERMVKEKGA